MPLYYLLGMQQKQQLNLFSLTMIVIGLVIGMGIFRTAATSAQGALSPAVYFSAWFAGGLVALCGALTYAEIGSRYPVTGGYYKIFAKAYHPSVAFAINCLILVSNAASLSGVALIGSGYLLRLFPGQYNDVHKALVSCVAIIIFYLINLKGLRMSSRTQNVLMLIKIAMVLVLIAALFFPDAYATQGPVATAAETGFSPWVKSLGVSLIAVSFTYGGYQQTINFGSEVKQPARNIPRGILIGILIIIGLYLLVNLSYFNIIGFNQMKNEKEIAYVVIEKISGKTGAAIFSAFLFLGVLAYVNGLLLSNPRVMYAMGEDKSLPSIFARQQKDTGVTVFSLTVFAAICIVILFFSQRFEKILSFTIFLDCFGMILSSATIFWFRKKTKHLDGTGIYKMTLFPLLPIIFIAAYLFVGVSIVIDDAQAALTGLAVMAAFIIIYFIFHNKNVKTDVPETTHSDILH